MLTPCRRSGPWTALGLPMVLWKAKIGTANPHQPLGHSTLRAPLKHRLTGAEMLRRRKENMAKAPLSRE